MTFFRSAIAANDPPSIAFAYSYDGGSLLLARLQSFNRQLG